MNPEDLTCMPSLATCFASVHVSHPRSRLSFSTVSARSFLGDPLSVSLPSGFYVKAVAVAVFFLSEYMSYPLPSSDLYLYADLL